MPQDFSHQNLRGRSFKGQDLALANFSYADIRGADFSGANLRGANFTGVRAGLHKWWIAGFSTILVGIFILTFVVAFAFIQGGWFHPSNFLFNGIALVLFAIVCVTAIYRGIAAVIVVITLFTVCVLLLMGISALTGKPVIPFTIILILPLVLSSVGAGLLAICTATFETALGATVANLVIVVYGVTLLTGTWLGTQTKTQGFESLPKYLVATVSTVWILAQTLIGGYIGWQTIVGNQKFVLFRRIAIALAAIGGTSFQDADLTDANFTGATLTSTDLRNALLTRTCWLKTKWLERACIGNSYLKYEKVQQLVITGWGVDQNFSHLNLSGINLKGAYLQDANFIGASLSQANLQDCDLSRAKLKQTQLDETDFTGATLTGAYIEDWGITSDTLFHGVRCEYIYLRLPTKENPDPWRKPDNREEVFTDGEFGDFIKPIFDTLDLYHNQGVDPRAIAISFKQLAENHPNAELEIVAMEKRGQDKFLLRAKTAIAADKSQLSAEYFATYNQLKALAEQEVKALIAEKDSRIADLQNMVVTALQRPSFYSNVEQVGFMTNNSSGFSVGGSVGGDINNVQGENNQQRVNNKTSNFNLQNAQFGGGLINADTVNAQQIGGNITNYNPEQKQNLVQAAAEIQQLLNQLSQTYPTATTSQRMTVVAKAVDEIESNPTLKARVIGALKAGGTEAFKELIDHPLVNILLASIEGWQEAE
ncbi:MAG: pentapeptide repeat-containing protein [Nostoc sp. ChiSLP01]